MYLTYLADLTMPRGSEQARRQYDYATLQEKLKQKLAVKRERIAAENAALKKKVKDQLNTLRASLLTPTPLFAVLPLSMPFKTTLTFLRNQAIRQLTQLLLLRRTVTIVGLNA